MILDKKDIIGIYEKLKKYAFKEYNRGSYDKCLTYINISAQIACKFSWKFKDDDFEHLLNEMSKSLLKPVENYSKNENRYVFYDSFSYDNRGLTQQYTRTLMSLGVHFLYITESSIRNSYSKNIFSELMEYDKAEILEFSKDINKIKKIKLIYKQIVEYKPSKIYNSQNWL